MSKKARPEPEEVVQPEEVAKPEEAVDQEKPHKCPFCKYTSKTPSLLSRHINHHHPELKDNTPAGLLGILQDKATVPEILSAVAGWIDKDTSFDDRLPEDVITYLRREDAKTQLILRIIAIDKIQRALELGERIKKVERTFDETLNDAQFKKEASPQSCLSLIERMQDVQDKELGFLKELTQLGQVNLNDVIDKLVGAFGSAKLGNKKTVSAFQLTGITGLDGLDELNDPSDRENVRKILTQVLAQNGSGDANNIIEAEAEESSPGSS